MDVDFGEVRKYAVESIKKRTHGPITVHVRNGDRIYTVHGWDTRLEREGFIGTDVHSHSYAFNSLLMLGKLRNLNYLLVPEKKTEGRDLASDVLYEKYEEVDGNLIKVSDDKFYLEKMQDHTTQIDNPYVQGAFDDYAVEAGYAHVTIPMTRTALSVVVQTVQADVFQAVYLPVGEHPQSKYDSRHSTQTLWRTLENLFNESASRRLARAARTRIVK